MCRTVMSYTILSANLSSSYGSKKKEPTPFLFYSVSLSNILSANEGKSSYELTIGIARLCVLCIEVKGSTFIGNLERTIGASYSCYLSCNASSSTERSTLFCRDYVRRPCCCTKTCAVAHVHSVLI